MTRFDPGPIGQDLPGSRPITPDIRGVAVAAICQLTCSDYSRGMVRQPWISGAVGARPPDSRFASTSSLRRKCLCSRGGPSRFPLFGGLVHGTGFVRCSTERKKEVKFVILVIRRLE